MPLLEFVVIGTPVSSQGSSDNRKFWQERVRREGRKAATDQLPVLSDVVLRLAYFYLIDPIGDLDNIVKPIQDALKEIAYMDDKQVIDLVASMRGKASEENVIMTPILADGFRGKSDFVHVVVDHSSRIEAFL